MKIVYFGTDVFIETFSYLLEKNEILALYTYHKNEDFFTEYEIVKLARKHRIPVYYNRIDLKEIKRYFLEEGCELFFVAEYDAIIPVPKDMPNFRAINTHSSLLPEGRSYYPIEIAMYKGLERTGVTIHKLANELDAGDIIMQEAFPIYEEDSSIDIYNRCAKVQLEMVKRLMVSFESFWENAVPQNEKCKYWKRPDEKELTITHTIKLDEAKQIYRCFNRMTKVNIQNALYYVHEFEIINNISKELEENFIYISEKSVLYKVLDGYIQIGIEQV
ncbi:MAG: formyltransferase family protein [Proteocatella sp.]